MNITELPITVLAAVLIGVAALFVVMRGLRLPERFMEQEKQRSAMRRRMMELELSQKEEEEKEGSGTEEPASGKRS
ncbi:MAG: hypothetical protein JXA71_05785 [Chitinispirillaceae bacterium]|nr:hypothetical protein [Chitinispirillaceae bacterium]